MNFSTLPKKRFREPMGVRKPTHIRCEGHLRFIRGRRCILADEPGHMCRGKVEACHVRTGTDGGMGLKPSDCFTYPGCEGAHDEQHAIGEPAFERKYRKDLKSVAAGLWAISPPGKRYRDRMKADALFSQPTAQEN